MPLHEVTGNLLDQRVDAIVNAWNRNLIPWWLLLPQGVSGAIKQRAGLAPFRELARMGPLPLGHAVRTSAGRLPFKAIIHVAGIDMRWRASRKSIEDSARNAVAVAKQAGFASLAIPVIGAGSGGFSEAAAAQLLRDVLEDCAGALDVTLVRFRG